MPTFVGMTVWARSFVAPLSCQEQRDAAIPKRVRTWMGIAASLRSSQ